MNYQAATFTTSLRDLQATFWLRRVALGLVRAAWLSLLAPTMFMFGYLWLNWHVSWPQWVIPMLAIGAVTLFWSMRPVGLKRVVRRLDSRLDLQTRLITALEVSRGAADDNPVVDNLLDESGQIVNTLRRRVHLLNRSLWLEMQALIAVMALLGALLLLDALSPRLPQVPPLDLPTAWQEPKADASGQAPLAQSISPEDVKTDPLKENSQDALQILADAFRDHAATHAVAVAIDERDVHRAAEGLRRLADQLDQLSPQGREELRASMQEAGDKIGEMAPSISEPLRAGNLALANNDLPQAGQALEELAKAIEQVQNSPAEIAQPKEVEQQNVEAQQTQLEPQNQTQEDKPQEKPQEEKQPPEEEQRLEDEGKPLEIPSDPPTDEKVVQAADPNAEASDKQAEQTPFTRQPPDALNQELGRDPLTYPWEKREVVRRYFTP